MRTFKVIAALLFGPSLGIIAGFLLGALLLSRDSSDYRAPGDGLLILFWMAAGFAISTLASVRLARWIWKRSSPN